MPVVKAAAVQLSPVIYSRQGTVGKVVQKIIELGRQGVEFATFPETVVPYYPYFSFVEAPYLTSAEHFKLLDQAVTAPSDATKAIGGAAKQAGMVVSIGVNEHDGGTIITRNCCSLQTARSSSTVAIFPQPTMCPWSEVRAMARGCAVSTAPSGRIGQLASREHYAIEQQAIGLWPDTVRGWKVTTIHPDLRDRFQSASLAGPVFSLGVLPCRTGRDGRGGRDHHLGDD